MAMTPSYCQHCGTILGPPLEGWPHGCLACGRYTYNSPKPVVAVIIRARGMWGAPYPGILLIKRGIEPYKNEWAFPGGYIDHAEDWRDAAIREAREEVGVDLVRENLVLRGNPVSTPTNYLVLFVESTEAIDRDRRAVNEADWPWRAHDLTSTLNDTGEQEVLEIAHVFPKDRDNYTLGVPSHQQVWADMPKDKP